MDTETILRELRAVEKEHKNDISSTCSLNISLMVRDCITKIDELQKENIELKEQLKRNIFNDFLDERDL